jgi:hypothetical protein
MKSLVLLGLAVACGGSTRSDPAGSSGGWAGSSSDPTVATAGAGVPNLTLDPVMGPPEPPICLDPAPACRLRNTYVQIEDDGPMKLGAPFDADCASCWPMGCEDCGTLCELSATGVASCGTVTLKIAVCAGENHAPPCLNTLGDEPYYLDAQGKTWSVISLSGAADAEGHPALLDAELSLVLRDATVTRQLPTHVRVCAELAATLRPCK